jgi:hypothetical protein
MFNRQGRQERQEYKNKNYLCCFLGVLGVLGGSKHYVQVK